MKQIIKCYNVHLFFSKKDEFRIFLEYYFGFIQLTDIQQNYKYDKKKKKN